MESRRITAVVRISIDVAYLIFAQPISAPSKITAVSLSVAKIELHSFRESIFYGYILGGT